MHGAASRLYVKPHNPVGHHRWLRDTYYHTGIGCCPACRSVLSSQVAPSTDGNKQSLSKTCGSMSLKPLTYWMEVIFGLLVVHGFWLLQWYGATSTIFEPNKPSHWLLQHLRMATDSPNMGLFPARGTTVKPQLFPRLLLHLISLLWTGVYSFLQPFKHSRMVWWWLCTTHFSPWRRNSWQNCGHSRCMCKPYPLCLDDSCIKSGLYLAVNVLSGITFARIRSCGLLAMVPLIRTQCWLHMGGFWLAMVMFWIREPGQLMGSQISLAPLRLNCLALCNHGVFAPFLLFPWHPIHQSYH